MGLARTIAEYEAIGPRSKEFVRRKASWLNARDRTVGVLARLSQEALDEFDMSMSFSRKSGCLLSAKCEKIAEELGEEVSTFFALFGIDEVILGEFYPYRCMGPRGCIRYPGFYCFSTPNDPCNNGD